MAEKQIFSDDEKMIELLDKLVSIQYPDEYGTIHRVTPDSEAFRIVPKYSPLGPGKDGYRYAASVKEAFEILRNNRNYELRWYTGPCDTVRDIKLRNYPFAYFKTQRHSDRHQPDFLFHRMLQ